MPYKDPIVRKEYFKRNYLKNRTKILEQTHQRYIDNPIPKQEYNKKYSKEHREQINSYWKERKKDPEYLKEYNRYHRELYHKKVRKINLNVVDELEEQFIGNFNLYEIRRFLNDIYYYYKDVGCTRTLLNKYRMQFLIDFEEHYGIKSLDRGFMTLMFLYIMYKEGRFVSSDLKKYDKIL